MDEKIKISEICYYGYAGLDLAKIKSALPLHVGDEFADYMHYHQACLKVKDSVLKVVGKPSSEEALIFYDKRYVVYIGLPGKSNQALALLPVPTGQVTASLKVTARIHELYEATMQANNRQLRSADEKDKQTYADLGEQTKKEALKNPDALMHVLKSSADVKERLVAAHALGLIASSKEQLETLVLASADSDRVVRNNAIRALGVILTDHPEYAPQIPCKLFVDLINSPEWTDRNKGVFVLLGLSKSRNTEVLAEMRARCLPSLIEMCQWPEGYSGSALMLLGRVGNLPDEKIEALIHTHDQGAIIKAAQASDKL
ncbi:MAG: HEAT repeat domain-containing protein [Cyanobacteria bacterium REEB67]|nr:HEAT repeat domain-containing protein [Cyanobacteria bacterium REEB67]